MSVCLMKTLIPIKMKALHLFFYRILGQLDIMSRRSLHDGERSARIAPTPVERHSFEDGVYPFQHLHLPWMRTERERGECTWWSSTAEGGKNTHRGGRCRAAERTVPPSCLVSGHRWAATPPEASPPPPDREGGFYFSLFALRCRIIQSVIRIAGPPLPKQTKPILGK